MVTADCDCHFDRSKNVDSINIIREIQGKSRKPFGPYFFSILGKRAGPLIIFVPGLVLPQEASAS